MPLGDLKMTCSPFIILPQSLEVSFFFSSHLFFSPLSSEQKDHVEINILRRK